MSYTSLLRHRCTVLRPTPTVVSGLSGMTWQEVSTEVKCFLDLTFIRRGKDPVWTLESGRASERSGVLMAKANAPIRSGDRVEMTKGPPGVFSIEGAADEAWRPQDKHHMEFGVVEVGSPLAKGHV